ncbi:response regulator transcription factor [Microbacterium sp. Bi128]|uniref:response regulator transcription factor n=1 Tax=Microbacterium sp. Bi128 TaxID=2821115 RepID=UPI001D38271A|nr:response regulator transcription factor [Microbacterium sp. Bi128]CAH0162477.1 Transcriptional regulatory protein LiaR [Microbacterium sp. Bi128]
MSQIRVLIVDDDPLVRAALSHFLTRSPGTVVVGEAGDGRDALDQVGRHQPDVVLMDVRMPRMDGIDTTAHIAERWPDVRVLAVTTFDTVDTVLPMLHAGASGYLLKDSPAEEIVQGVHRVQEGTTSLSPRIAALLIEHVRTRARPAPVGADGLEKLTDREGEVLRCLARGMSNAEISTELFVSEGTVKACLGRIMTKWGVRDRVQIIVAAAQAGIVSFT